MKLLFNTNLCTECHSCELMCSMAHFNVYNTHKASLKIKTRFPNSPKLDYCRQCNNALCIAACGYDALYLADGYVVMDKEKCVECGDCLTACPFDAIFNLPEGTYIKCDECNGQFKCVKSCATGALSLKKEGK